MIGRNRSCFALTLLAACLVIACSPGQSSRSPPREIAQQQADPGEPSAEDIEFWLGVSESELLDQAGRPFTERPPEHPQPMPAGDLSGAVISFTRCCAGFVAPDYRLELRGNGQATFDGRAALLTGVHRFQVSPAEVQSLVKNLEAANFWALGSKYDCGMSHGARLTLSVELGGQKKTVSHHCGVGRGLPQRIVEIERAIVTAGDGPRWLIGTDATLDQLEREGFDFKSVAGADLLSRAMMYSSSAFIQELLARGTPLDTSHGPLIAEAAFAGRRGAFQTLIKAGAFQAGSEGKQAALERAIQACRPEMVAEILPHKPDLTARSQDYGGRNLLELADLCSDPEDGVIREMLIAEGADPKMPGLLAR